MNPIKDHQKIIQGPREKDKPERKQKGKWEAYKRPQKGFKRLQKGMKKVWKFSSTSRKRPEEQGESRRENQGKQEKGFQRKNTIGNKV